MRKICLVLIMAALGGGAFGAESDAEKSRALSQSSLKIIEKALEEIKISRERGLADDDETGLLWTERWIKTKLELGTTPEERVALAEKRLKVSKDLHELKAARYKAGQVRRLELLDAELKVLEAEQALLQAKKQ